MCDRQQFHASSIAPNLHASSTISNATEHPALFSSFRSFIMSVTFPAVVSHRTLPSLDPSSSIGSNNKHNQCNNRLPARLGTGAANQCRRYVHQPEAARRRYENINAKPDRGAGDLDASRRLVDIPVISTLPQIQAQASWSRRRLFPNRLFGYVMSDPSNQCRRRRELGKADRCPNHRSR